MINSNTDIEKKKHKILVKIAKNEDNPFLYAYWWKEFFKLTDIKGR